MPILIKEIKANNNLSVQVHPSDDYANKYENDFRLIHFYLLDKERIIRGGYTCKKRNEKVLENIIKQLAYGEIRDKILREK